MYGLSLESPDVVCEWAVDCFEVFDDELEMCNVLWRRIQGPGLLGGRMAVHRGIGQQGAGRRLATLDVNIQSDCRSVDLEMAKNHENKSREENPQTSSSSRESVDTAVWRRNPAF